MTVVLAAALVVVAGGEAAATSRERGPVLPPCPTSTATGCDHAKDSSGAHGSSACRRTGSQQITASPIALNDLLYIQPMGLMIGGHVTPIDHGYFYIKGAMADPPTQAAVYAPMDATITSVTRTVRQGDPAAKSDHPQRATYDDDAVTLEGTCSFR